MNDFMPQDEIIKGKFIFVSYSHHEMEMVRNDVVALHKKSVRIWFDDNLQPSDEWNAIAKSIIEHENCIGVLFYNSEYSFASTACNEERKYTIERRKRDVNFKYWFININDEETDILVGKAFPIAISKGISNFTKIISEYISPLFEENIIRINCNGNDHLSSIYNLAQENYFVDNEFNAIKAMDSFNLVDRGTGLIQLGSFIGSKCEIPIAHEGDNECFFKEGKQYIIFENEIYYPQLLYWKLLYVKDSVAVLLCDSIVTKKQGGKDVDSFLTQEFYNIAFSESEKTVISTLPRLLLETDIANVDGMLSLGFSKNTEFNMVHYWIKADGMLPNWQSTIFNKTLNKKGFIISVKKGVRPVIEIPIDKLNNIKR